MKKIACLLVIANCTLLIVHAQLNDAQWMIGWSPNSQIDFRNDTPVVSTVTKVMRLIRWANAAISDNMGELRYYTNGIYIAGKLSNGDSILNGNGLNPSSFVNQYANEGLPDPQCLLFLNKPNDTENRYYYLIYFTGDNGGVCYTLYHSLIDMQGNFGLGEVISKNDTFYQGITRTGGMTACRHANGRDWWIVIPSRNNNLYRKFLLTPNGITDTILQNIGPDYMGPVDQSFAKFTLDGTKYAISSPLGLITVMDFDRCTGEFSNPRTINNAESGNSPGAMIEFSPNGRFIYATNTEKLEQYDLDNPNIQDSVLIFRCGCPANNSGVRAYLADLALAYDGRIYGRTASGGFYFLHVINFPDEFGIDCNFVYGGQPTLSSNSINISNTANPRLGALAGSGCDTLTTTSPNLSKGEEQIRVMPNPADKAFYIEMPAPASCAGSGKPQCNYVFELISMAGQVVERRETKQVDIINVQGIDNGAYILRVTSPPTPGGGLRQVAAKKVIVQHP